MGKPELPNFLIFFKNWIYKLADFYLKVEYIDSCIDYQILIIKYIDYQILIIKDIDYQIYWLSKLIGKLVLSLE